MTIEKLYISSKIPSIYWNIMTSLIDYTVPEENWATCNACVLQRKVDSAYINTKCCTYYPHLMNYMVGGLLQDTDPMLDEGKRRVREKIQNRFGITPFGVISTVAYDTRRRNWDKQDKDERKKGNEKFYTVDMVDALRCAYYDQGICTVWAYREHGCSTHFCVSVGGSDGKNFWREVENYLIQVEEKLSKYALLELGWNPDNIYIERINGQLLNIDDEYGNFNEEAYKELWGDWLGREEELYSGCYQIIKALTPERFNQIMGIEQDILLKRIEKKYQAFINPSVPDYLTYNQATIITPSVNKGYVDLKVQEDGHGRMVPEFITRFLPLFDGKKTTDEILNSVQPLGTFFKRDFLIPLYKNGILESI